MKDDWSLAITGAGEYSTEFETIYNMIIKPKCIEGVAGEVICCLRKYSRKVWAFPYKDI